MLGRCILSRCSRAVILFDSVQTSVLNILHAPNCDSDGSAAVVFWVVLVWCQVRVDDLPVPEIFFAYLAFAVLCYTLHGRFADWAAVKQVMG